MRQIFDEKQVFISLVARNVGDLHHPRKDVGVKREIGSAFTQRANILCEMVRKREHGFAHGAQKKKTCKNSCINEADGRSKSGALR